MVLTASPILARHRVFPRTSIVWGSGGDIELAVVATLISPNSCRVERLKSLTNLRSNSSI